MLIGIAVAGVVYPLWWNHRSVHAGQRLLQRALPKGLATGGHTGAGAVCPIRSSVGSTGATDRHPGVIEIPAIGLTAPVLAGLSNQVLDVAVGHDPATVWPGARGESVLLAHDVSYFSALDRVRPGDTVIWTLGCERALFRVTAGVVTRPGVTLPAPPSGYGLALITCWPTNALFWTPERYLVTARLIARRRLGRPAADRPPPLLRLRVPAPPALVAQGLSLARSGVLVGRLTVRGTPTRAFREGPQPLAVANAALRDYAAAAKAAAAGNRSWWRSLTVAGVALPAPWSLAYDTNVTLVVRAASVQAVILSSPAKVVRLTVRDGVLRVASVRP